MKEGWSERAAYPEAIGLQEGMARGPRLTGNGTPNKQTNNRKRPKLGTIRLGQTSFSLPVPTGRLMTELARVPGSTLLFILFLFIFFIFDDVIPNSP